MENKLNAQPLSQSVLIRWLPETDATLREAARLRQQELSEEKRQRRAERQQRLQRVRERRQRIRRQAEQLPKPLQTGLAVSLGLLALTVIGFGLSRWQQRRRAQVFGESLPIAMSVELGSLSGTWYELARFQHPQEQRAVGSRIDVVRVGDNDLRLTYRCELDGFHGDCREQSYQVHVDEDHHVRLKVFGPIVYDYVLLEQDDDYVVIGGTDRRHLWILARTPHIEASRFDNIVIRMANRGFDVRRLVLVPQQQGLPALPEAESMDALLNAHSLW